MTTKKSFVLSLFFIALCSCLQAQTIQEKRAGLAVGITDLDPKLEAELIEANRQLEQKKEHLAELYADVYELYALDAPPEDYEELLQQVRQTKKEIREVNQRWQKLASQSAMTDIYALWHQPDTTIDQLVTDYGAQDYVYVMPPNIAEIKISVNSNIPIPQAAWENMLDLILTQNGIGIRELNPYLRELYLLDVESSPVNYITDKQDDLEYLPRNQRIAFLLTPDPSDVRRSWTFLNKFINPMTTRLEQFGREILIISQVGEIQDLLKLYNFAATEKNGKHYKLVPLTKIKAEEMAKVISAMFDHMSDVPVVLENDGAPPARPDDGYLVNGLKIIILDTLSQAIFLVGTDDEIRKAEEMIHNIESKIAGGREKVVQWYRAKHSSAEDLAATLQQVYTAMMTQRIRMEERRAPNGVPDQMLSTTDVSQSQDVTYNQIERPREPFPIFNDSFYASGEPVIYTPPIDPAAAVHEKPKDPKVTPNFIVDEKTGAVIMVVEKDLLPRLMQIVAKLDIPKKMVQIDVLVFERRTREHTDYGLNLLKIGGCASQSRLSCIDWNQPAALGLFQFLLSRPRTDGGFPAFDLVYKFLLTQENLTLNANPSVVTINQTPAEISIREEISLQTGINFIATTNANTPQNTFKREQYGITITVTPTVHLWDEESEFPDTDDVDYITLETYINFDTIEPTPQSPDRPNVVRRVLKNEVLIADGQTVVMGGLRRKVANDGKQSIPFFGEIPGFGKLFSMNEMEDRTTELIVFMTPQIIHDPCVGIEKIKYQKVNERPGELPSFLYRLNESLEAYQRRAFAQTIKILCGNPHTHYYPTQIGCVPAPIKRGEGASFCGDYDGR
jgi:general secretion pathway protein D